MLKNENDILLNDRYEETNQMTKVTNLVKLS